MRRLVLAALVLAPLALLTPGASAQQELPCKYWVHGCDAAAYVRDLCERETTLDCGIV
jgi:hypothetical protein